MGDSKMAVHLDGEFTAREMEEIIGELAKARATMQPEVPRTLDGAAMTEAQSLIECTPDFQFSTLVNGGLRIHLRNSGLGWLAFELTAEERQGMLALLGDQVTDARSAH